MGNAIVGLLQSQRLHKLLEPFAVFGKINHIGRRTQDRDARVLKGLGNLERGLAPKLHDHTVQGAVFLFDPQDLHHMFKGQRFKVQPVRCVIVGRYGFGVTVHHDGFVTSIGQRIAGVTTTIVKFDPLPDTVRTAAQYHHLAAVRRARFALDLAKGRYLVGGVHIRSLSLEFRRTCIDTLEHSLDAQVKAGAAHVVFVATGQRAKARIGKAHHLELAHPVFGQR